MEEYKVTIGIVAELMGMESFDTALPHDWCNDVYNRTGKYPLGHMVWCYDEQRIFGEAAAITREGQAILNDYKWQLSRKLKR